MYAHILGGYQFHLSNDRAKKLKSGQPDFRILDPKAALRKLKRLQTQGFGVPDYAIERLQEEVEALTTGSKRRSNGQT